MAGKVGINMTSRAKRKMYKKKGKLTLYKVASQVRQLQKVANSRELKLHQMNIFTGMNDVGQIFNMTQIAEGTAETQRVGLKINPKRFDLNLNLSAESGDQNIYRIVVFRWFEDLPPARTDILEDNTAGSFLGYNNYAVPTKWQKKPKYQILDDTKLTVADGTAEEDRYYYFTKHFKKNSEIRYDASSPSSQEWGNIYVYICSDSAVVPHPIVQGYSRLTFFDS